MALDSTVKQSIGCQQPRTGLTDNFRTTNLFRVVPQSGINLSKSTNPLDEATVVYRLSSGQIVKLFSAFHPDYKECQQPFKCIHQCNYIKQNYYSYDIYRSQWCNVTFISHTTLTSGSYTHPQSRSEVLSRVDCSNYLEFIVVN